MPTIIHFRWTRLATLAAVVCVGAGLTHSSTAEARRFSGLKGLTRAARTAAVGARVYGQQSSGEYVLSRGELKACLVMEDRMTPIVNRLESTGNRIDQDQESLSALGREIQRGSNLVDTNSQYEIDRFNQKIDQYETERAQLQARMDRWNAQVETMRSDFELFDAQCGGRSYYTSDRTAVMASINN